MTRPILRFLLVLGVIFVLGCEEDSVRVYHAPKVPTNHAHTAGPLQPAAPPTTAPAAAPASSPLIYDLPEGWTDIPADGMRVAAFEVGQTSVTVIPLPASMNELNANINRWREQVNLPKLPVDQIPEPMSIDTLGTTAPYVVLEGEAEAILGVLPILGDQVWFIKLRGPLDEALAQREAFEGLVRSMRLKESPTP